MTSGNSSSNTPPNIKYKVANWCRFEEQEAYILMAISRRKFNPNIGNSEEVIHRRILTCEDDVDSQVDDILALINRHEINFRIYLTVNPRDIVSAYHAFVQELVSWSELLYNNDTGVHTKMERISSEWKSMLHKPEHKADSLFQFDLDDVDEKEGWKFHDALSAETDVVGFVETPNGYHIMSEPFNYTQWDAPVAYDDLDTDGMLHIAAINNGVEIDDE